jgi:hypothetical protein
VNRFGSEGKVLAGSKLLVVCQEGLRYVKLLHQDIFRQP